MTEVSYVLTAGGLSALVLEGVKWLVRLVMKKPTFDFATGFYLVAIPVLNALMVIPFAFLGMAEMPVEWLDFGKSVVIIALSSLTSVIVYKNGIKPLKEYSRLELDKG